MLSLVRTTPQSALLERSRLVSRAVDAKHLGHVLDSCFPTNVAISKHIAADVKLLERLVLFESLTDGLGALLPQLVFGE